MLCGSRISLIELAIDADFFTVSLLGSWGNGERIPSKEVSSKELESSFGNSGISSLNSAVGSLYSPVLIFVI